MVIYKKKAAMEYLQLSILYIYICCIDTSSATDTAVLLR